MKMLGIYYDESEDGDIDTKEDAIKHEVENCISVSEGWRGYCVLVEKTFCEISTYVHAMPLKIQFLFYLYNFGDLVKTHSAS